MEGVVDEEVSDVTCESELGSSEKIDIVSAMDEVDSTADDVVRVVNETGCTGDDVVCDVDEADAVTRSADIEEMAVDDIILHTSSGGIVYSIDAVDETQSIISANISYKSYDNA